MNVTKDVFVLLYTYCEKGGNPHVINHQHPVTDKSCVLLDFDKLRDLTEVLIGYFAPTGGQNLPGNVAPSSQVPVHPVRSHKVAKVNSGSCPREKLWRVNWEMFSKRHDSIHRYLCMEEQQ